MENIAEDFLKNLGAKVNMIDEHEAQRELDSWGIDESVVDFEKKDLNPALWKDKKIKKAARDQIWKAILIILDEANIDEDRLTAAMIEGSNLTYYYNKYTDIDIHLYIEDVTESEEEKIGEHINEFNVGEEVIVGTKNVLEMYLMDEDQLNRLNGPRYDLLKEKWITNPEKIKIKPETYKAAVEISFRGW